MKVELQNIHQLYDEIYDPNSFLRKNSEQFLHLKDKYETIAISSSIGISNATYILCRNMFETGLFSNLSEIIRFAIINLITDLFHNDLTIVELFEIREDLKSRFKIKTLKLKKPIARDSIFDYLGKPYRELVNPIKISPDSNKITIDGKEYKLVKKHGGI